ncbi:MAG: DUF6702 family protein [Pseudomonadota bacterium]
MSAVLTVERAGRSLSMTTVLVLLLMVPFAMPQAHQQKAALTQIQYNERSGMLEIMHRFYLHDAEHAVRRLLDPEADIIHDDRSRRQFAEYVTQRFALYRGNGSALPLSLVGQELDGQFFWVYQELAVDTPPKTVTARHDALRDLWSDQTNTVNIHLDGSIQTLTFSGNDRRLTTGPSQ